MSNHFRDQLYRNLNQKGSNELIDIWQTNNRSEWTELAFDVIREILQERLIELPPQGEPVLESSNDQNDKNDISDMTLLQVYFSFNGRIGLSTYWLKGVIPSIVLSFIAGGILGIISHYSKYYDLSRIIWLLITAWSGLAITVKRWHDRDKSGWWILIGLIPFLGIIWAFIENGFLPGTKGPNKYGAKSF